MASAPHDWWPISESNPVPGDPDTLAALGKHMRDAAAEIQRMASQLPKLASSEIWDSDAGDAFRVKSKSVATDIGKAQGRFHAVATALGTSTYGGSGYAAELQEYQDQAYTAAGAVGGTAGAQGSEAKRLSTWNQLLAANDGQSPLVPPPKGGNKPGQVNPAAAVAPGGTAYPPATPGSIPSDLPVFPTDPAEVRSLKGTYNDQLAILRSSVTAVNNAAGNISSAAQRAASMIHQVTDHDGLNNPPWWESAWHDVTSFVSTHWVGFLKMVSKVAGIISMVCAIIAMVLAFIPGLQPFAALFEAVALLAQLVATVCDVILLATGNGSLSSVIFDGIGLVTFGLGGGLIGKLGATAEVVGNMAKAFKAAKPLADAGDILGPADAALNTLGAAKQVSFISKVLSNAKESFAYKSLVTKAIESVTNPQDAAQIAKLAELKNLGFGGALAKGLRGAVTFNSPEIVENLDQMTEDAGKMTTTTIFSGATVGEDGSLGAWAKVVTVSVPAARVIVDSSAVYQNVFRVVQAAGLGSSAAGVAGVFG
jgi:hypothetical protein